ncbi:MAG: hypothetical protein FWE42_05675 [Defluviitaleaceae bacterium]|nr:hypothetical protein [Defluviitaleaceae bacterium]
MGLQEIIKRIYHTFLLAWALISVILCVLAIALGWRAIEVNKFLALFSIVAITTLTYFIFYSKNELSVRQFIIRLGIQICIIMGIVLGVGYHVGLIGSECMITTVVTIVSAILISALMTAIEIYKTWMIADKLNLKLRDRAKK